MPVSDDYRAGFRQGFLLGAKHERKQTLQRLRASAGPVEGNKQAEGRPFKLTAGELAREGFASVLEYYLYPPIPDQIP